MFLSERNKSEKAIYYMIQIIQPSGKCKTTQTKRSVVSRVLMKRRLNRWDSRNFFGSDNILYNIVMVIKLCICQKPSNKAQRWTLIYLNFKKSFRRLENPRKAGRLWQGVASMYGTTWLKEMRRKCAGQRDSGNDLSL